MVFLQHSYKKMLRFFLFYIYRFFLLNSIILSIRERKFIEKNYNYDFRNIIFEDLLFLKNIFLKKKYFNSKFYDKESKVYHSFDWLIAAKNLGGTECVLIAKKQIINWYNKKYSKNTFVWNDILTSKRLINLIYNYDFYAISSTNNEKILFRKIILAHFIILDLLNRFRISKKNISIEMIKILLLFKLIHKKNINDIIYLLKEQMRTQIDKNGFHKSNNPSYQAEFINNLHEIKNIFLFFEIKVPDSIQYQIYNMTSVLGNLIHKDNSIALFNGSNSANYNNIVKIINLSKDIKLKNLENIKNGIAVYSNNKFKIFFDVVKPSNKEINQNLHASTLSFELSYDNEKIITNCGSIEKRFVKRPDYFRYSAAHSTIVVANTNISELVEKKSYKRIPRNIIFENSENEDSLIWTGSHDGYIKNFNKIIKRKIKIYKKFNKIEGEDTIITTKLHNKKILYNVRFHLTPNCSCLLTNNNKNVLIKTQGGQSWIFTSKTNLTLEDSIYIKDGKKIEQTKQIVISNYSDASKQKQFWSITKT